MNSEDTITIKLVDILETMRNAWEIEPQNTQTFLDSRKKPDFTVKEKGRAPVVAEVKIDDANSPDLSGESQTKKHLGRRLASYEVVTTAMAVRFPDRFRDIPNRELTDEIRLAKDLHYVLLSVKDDILQGVQRYPNDGWIQGSVTDIATAIRTGAMPISRLEHAAYDLEYGVDEAAKLLEDAIEERPEIGRQIEDILHQESCLQTSRMSMLILTNAFVFQSILARKPGLKDVPSLGQLRSINHRLNVTHILEAWDQIYQVNYRPIFDVAIKLVNALASDDELVGEILLGLRDTAQKLIDKKLAQVHELAGIVFQRLIVDRKFIKTYYTRPVSVSLLSALVLPERDFTNEDPEVIKASLSECKIADFACGTGALLNGVYQRLLGFYEQAGGSGEAIHKDMVENNLWGFDIMPNASHLTAALIASNYPHVRIGGTKIEVMEYATRHLDGKWALGSLDFIEDPGNLRLLNVINPQRVRGDDSTGEVQHVSIRHGEMDIVIDNPPFTRVGANNDANDPEVPNTIFGDQNPHVVEQMQMALRNVDNSMGNVTAGLASYFVDLADRMLKTNGQSVMGFVLPITVLTSPDWKKIRELWSRQYHNLLVVTIADEKTKDCSFSADTNMAECLVIAIKGKSESTGRGTFVCLHHRPNSHLEAFEVARDIQNLQNVRRFEEPPIAGNPIKFGDEVVGSALDCPLKLTEPWVTTRVRELSLIQSAYHLANGHIWFPGQPTPVEIPMTTVGEMAEVQYDNTTITGKRGAFDFVNGCSDNDEYPGLHKVNAKSQCTMMVLPDKHGIIKSGYWDQAQRVLARNSRVHHMAKLRYNSNPLAVLFTERDSIGVNTIPNVAFANSEYDYVWTLWGNSTLGLLCYWMHGNKQHSGRGQIRLTALRAMPTLDMRKLDETAIQNAKNIFGEMKYKKMVPFNQMDEDPVRWELDRLLLSQVLGFGEDTHPEVHEGVRILRERLSKEPSIDGGKKERVVL